MGERIDLSDPLSRAHWCDEIDAAGLYLATRLALESFEASDL